MRDLRGNILQSLRHAGQQRPPPALKPQFGAIVICMHAAVPPVLTPAEAAVSAAGAHKRTAREGCLAIKTDASLNIPDSRAHAHVVSGRTDTITRWSSSELLTVPAVQSRPIGRHELGLGEFVQTLNALGVGILHKERRAYPRFHSRELDQLAQT